MYMFLILVPIISFWVLDGYYLRLERGYKELYDVVHLKKEDHIDFANIFLKNNDIILLMIDIEENCFYKNLYHSLTKINILNLF